MTQLDIELNTNRLQNVKSQLGQVKAVLDEISGRIREPEAELKSREHSLIIEGIHDHLSGVENFLFTLRPDE